MLEFIIMWIVTLIGVRIYLHVKKIDIGINIDVLSIILSFIFVSFLNFMHWFIGFLANLFIK